MIGKQHHKVEWVYLAELNVFKEMGLIPAVCCELSLQGPEAVGRVSLYGLQKGERVSHA